jgi:hypothetical protein
MKEGRHVPETELTAQERLMLLALMSVARKVTNAELKVAAGVELTGAARRRLNELKLVTSEKPGRAFVHQLTNAGAVRCGDELVAPRPDRAGSYGGVLYATLAVVQRYMERVGLPMSEFFKPDVQLLIREAYGRLADGPAAPVRLSALRREIDDAVSRKEVDAELVRMADQSDVYLRAVVNQQTLTDEDRDAAVRLGGEDRHNLQIEAR